MAKTVVGLFDHLAEARDAVQDLVNAGIDREKISVLANDTAIRHTTDDGRHRATDGGSNTTALSTTALDAGKGAIWGGVTGLLLGLGSFAIPGVGPVVAAGALTTAIGSTLAGAGLGAVAGGLIGALVTAGVPESHAHYYTESVRRGSVLVVAQADDATAQRAAEVMRTHGAVDFETRMDQYRESGFRQFDHSAAPLSPSEMETEHKRNLAPTSRSGASGRIYDAIGADYSTPGSVVDEEMSGEPALENPSVRSMAGR